MLALPLTLLIAAAHAGPGYPHVPRGSGVPRTIQSTEPQPSAPVVHWTTKGFVPAAPSPTTDTLLTDPPRTVTHLIWNAGGLTASPPDGPGTTIAWHVTDQRLTPAHTATPAKPTHSDLPQGWLFDGDNPPTTAAALTIDLNCARANAEPLYDAPWAQRMLHRLGLSNARLISLRGTLSPSTIDGQPPLLELKGLISARSVEPGKARTVRLIAPVWQPTPAENAAAGQARWVADIRSDATGLGQIGRDGGVGTWAGLIRLGVDVVGTIESSDTALWETNYTRWQGASSEFLRDLSIRLQPRATILYMSEQGSATLGLIVPARKGERIESLRNAVADIGKSSFGVMTDRGGGRWRVEPAAGVRPGVWVTTCEDPKHNACLVVCFDSSAEGKPLAALAQRIITAR